MIFRTLLFFVVMYFLVKFISRLFMPTSSGSGAESKAKTFYHTFQQFQQNRQRQQHARQNRNVSQRFEEIEEAEFEDITDTENSSSKTSD
ncbi:MAG: hypothetical protein PVH63_05315 [Balneolaceae bacterium]|jgi:hypothetical protein